MYFRTILSQEPTQATREMSQATAERSNDCQAAKDGREHRALSGDLGPLRNIAALDKMREGQPLFTRALLEQAAKDVEMLQDPGNWKVKISIPHVLGDGVFTTEVPFDQYHPRTLRFVRSLEMVEVEPVGACAPYDVAQDWNINRITATDTLKPNDSEQPLRQLVATLPDPPDLQEVRAIEAELLGSPFWANLKPQLEHMPVRIDNIVCVALGDLYPTSHPDEDELLSQRHSSQHLLACAISRHLSQHYASTDSPAADIPIIAYDPSYTLRSLDLLSRLSPPIDIVSSPHHFLSITPNTLIVMFCMPCFDPFHEIVADACFPSGPAAILSNEVWNHSWHEDGMAAYFEQWTPRVGRMLERYDKKWVGSVWDEAEMWKWVEKTMDNIRMWNWIGLAHLYARKE